MIKTFYFVQDNVIQINEDNTNSICKSTIIPCSCYEDAVNRADLLWFDKTDEEQLSYSTSVMYGDAETFEDLLKSKTYTEDVFYIAYKDKKYRIEKLPKSSLFDISSFVDEIEAANPPQRGSLLGDEYSCTINGISIRFLIDEYIFRQTRRIKVLNMIYVRKLNKH